MKQTVGERFWKAVCLYAFRRWRAGWSRQTMPVGVLNYRDPEHVCDNYVPGKPRPEDWNKCRGDGHYLCDECAYKKVDEELAQ